MKRSRSALYHFTLKYFVITLLFLLLMIPLYGQVYLSTKSSSIARQSQLFSKAADALDQSVGQSVSLLDTLLAVDTFRELKHLPSGAYPTDVYYKVRSVREIFSPMTFSDALVDDACILFQNSGIVIGNHKITHSFESYFGGYLQLPDGEAFPPELWADRSRQYFCRPVTLTLDGMKAGERLPFVVRKDDSSVRVILFYSARRLCELFGLDALPEGTFFYLADSSGERLLSYGDAGEPFALTEAVTAVSGAGGDYTAFREVLSRGGYELVLGVPDRYFASSALPAMRLILLYLCAAVLLGVVLSVLLALRTYAPLKRLLRVSSETSSLPLRAGTNEFKYLENVLTQQDVANRVLSEEVRKMEQSLRNNYLTRCLMGLVYTEDDRNAAFSLLPQLSGSYRVAAITVPAEGGEEQLMQTLVYAQLLRSLGGDFQTGQIDGRTAAVLFPDTPENRLVFEERVHILRQNIRHLYGAEAAAGLSASAHGLEAACTAFEQARLSASAPARADGRIVEEYVLLQAAEPAGLGLDKLRRLYMLTLNGNAQALQQFFAQTVWPATDGAGSSASAKEVFYTLRCLLRALCADQKLPQPLPHWRETETAHQLLSELLSAYESLGAALLEKARRQNEGLYGKILGDIQAHFSNPGLCASVLAARCGMSEKALYSLFKENGSAGIAEYIEEVRMDNALRLIRETDATVVQISSACGYSSPNTFHKAFKKKFGASPLSYRKR